MKEEINKINEKLTPYYSLLMMLVFFLGVFISIYKVILSPSDLRVISINDRISYPSTIGNYYDKIDEYLETRDTLHTEANMIQGFLIKTTDYKEITLKNVSSKTLRGVKFKLLNTDALTAWGVSSNFFTNPEEEALRKNLIFDELRNIVYFKSDLEIPANSEIYVRLWGSFKNDFFSENLLVNYDGGDAHIEKSYNISGIKGYFFNFIFEILAVTIIIFILVYYVGIKQVMNKK